jgi:hypothetical protein
VEVWFDSIIATLYSLLQPASAAENEDTESRERRLAEARSYLNSLPADVRTIVWSYVEQVSVFLAKDSRSAIVYVIQVDMLFGGQPRVFTLSSLESSLLKRPRGFMID